MCTTHDRFLGWKLEDKVYKNESVRNYAGSGGRLVEELQGYRELGKSLTEILRLQHFPLAIRLLESDYEFPERTTRPSFLNMRITMCVK